jgi:hypothetical protein
MPIYLGYGMMRRDWGLVDLVPSVNLEDDLEGVEAHCDAPAMIKMDAWIEKEDLVAETIGLSLQSV